jgi:tetratricopeptide (TPR) repeat protein
MIRALWIISACLVAGCTHPQVKNSAVSTAVASANSAQLDLQAQATEQEESFEERAAQVFMKDGANNPNLPKRALEPQVLYKFLVAELAAQRGNFAVAAQAYLDIAKLTRDPRLARRATEVATYGRLNDVALQAARLWIEVDKDSPQAKQSLVGVLVQTDAGQAKPYLEDMLKGEGKNVGQALLQLGNLFARTPDKMTVYEVVKDLCRPYKELPEGQLALSQAAFAANKYDNALVAVREALRIRPGWEVAVLFQAQMLQHESRGKALDYLKGYLDANPASQDVRLNYGRLLIAEKKFAEARLQFQKLLDENPGNPDVALTVGLLAMQANDHASAEKALKLALEQNYKDPDQVRVYLGQLSEDGKRYDEALKWYGAVGEGEQYISAHTRYAVVLARQGKLAEARTHIKQLTAQNDTQRVQIVQAEAQLLREVRAFRESFDVLKSALDQDPNQPELLYDVALAAEKVDMIDVLETNLRKLLQMKPDHAQAWNALGYTLADRTDRLSEARGYIEKALKLSPDDPFILDSMGWVLFRQGNHQEGQDYLQKAFTQRPDPEIAAHLGEVMWVRGNKSEAEKMWRDSLKDNPENEELQKAIKRFLR